MEKKRNRLEKIRLDFISGVDKPAQEGARVVLLKRNGYERFDKMTPKEGETVEEFMARFMADKAMMEEYPDEKQRLAVARSQFKEKTGEPAGIGKGAQMDELGRLRKELTTAQGALEVARAESALSDAERTHYASLADEGKAAFRKLDATGRRADLARLGDTNPAVFTSETGEIFRKNDDPRLVALAKRSDEDRRARRISDAALETAQLSKRAETVLANLPGEPAVKVALLKAVSGIADATIREGVESILKAGSDGLAPAFRVLGTPRAPEARGAEDKLDALAKRLASEAKVTIEKGMLLALGTAEGQELALAAREGN